MTDTNYVRLPLAGYSFGFNGQEKDNEITDVKGTHNTAMFWEYDTRLGMRWNMDPKPTVGVFSYLDELQEKHEKPQAKKQIGFIKPCDE